jgi:tRNA(Leu) C34 or U34 (ribose-2'-O)-methylase TrmL
MENVGFAAVGLHNPKSAVNVGGVLRAAGCFNVALVAVQGHRYREASTDVRKAYRWVPMIKTDDLHSVIPYSCVPVAIELVPEAVSLVNYVHPERAFYIFGAEDATLGQKVLSWCRDIVYIPTEYCLNLAVCVNVVLYDREAKKRLAQVEK